MSSPPSHPTATHNPLRRTASAETELAYLGAEVAHAVVEAQEPRVLGILGRVHWRPGRGGVRRSAWQAAVGAVRGVQRRAVAVAPAGAWAAVRADLVVGVRGHGVLELVVRHDVLPHQREVEVLHRRGPVNAGVHPLGHHLPHLARKREADLGVRLPEHQAEDFVEFVRLHILVLHGDEDIADLDLAAEVGRGAGDDALDKHAVVAVEAFEQHAHAREQRRLRGPDLRLDRGRRGGHDRDRRRALDGRRRGRRRALDGGGGGGRSLAHLALAHGVLLRREGAALAVGGHAHGLDDGALLESDLEGRGPGAGVVGRGRGRVVGGVVDGRVLDAAAQDDLQRLRELDAWRVVDGHEEVRTLARHAVLERRKLRLELCDARAQLLDHLLHREALLVEPLLLLTQLRQLALATAHHLRELREALAQRRQLVLQRKVLLLEPLELVALLQQHLVVLLQPADLLQGRRASVLGDQLLEVLRRERRGAAHDGAHAGQVLGGPGLGLVHDLDDAAHLGERAARGALQQLEQLDDLRVVNLRGARHGLRKLLEVAVLGEARLLHQHAQALQLIEHRLVAGLGGLQLPPERLLNRLVALHLGLEVGGGVLGVLGLLDSLEPVGARHHLRRDPDLQRLQLVLEQLELVAQLLALLPQALRLRPLLLQLAAAVRVRFGAVLLELLEASPEALELRQRAVLLLPRAVRLEVGGAGVGDGLGGGGVGLGEGVAELAELVLEALVLGAQRGVVAQQALRVARARAQRLVLRL
mmetsp:Transcript_38393/g.90614  ORF Transcript_38393/g.90614 Transcript_38393/m.90614 type:complete len:757 (+) Transcript_38393:263-2533(+)